jgi:hypothetical protein
VIARTPSSITVAHCVLLLRLYEFIFVLLCESVGRVRLFVSFPNEFEFEQLPWLRAAVLLSRRI